MSKLYKVNVYQEIDSLEYPKYKEGEEQIYYGEEE